MERLRLPRNARATEPIHAPVERRASVEPLNQPASALATVLMFALAGNRVNAERQRQRRGRRRVVTACAEMSADARRGSVTARRLKIRLRVLFMRLW